MITPTNSFKKHVSCCLWLAARLLKIVCIIPLKYFQTYFFTSTNCFQNCKSCWLLSVARLLKKVCIIPFNYFQTYILTFIFKNFLPIIKPTNCFQISESCSLSLVTRLLKIVFNKHLNFFKLISSPIYLKLFFYNNTYKLFSKVWELLPLVSG